MTLPAFAHPSREQALSQLQPLRTNDLRYGGDVSSKETYDYLRHSNGVLVDVRTEPEWKATGVPDLAGTQGRLVTLSWKTYPNYTLNHDFLIQCAAQPGLTPETPLFFLCRSGGRSLDAAVAMSAAGYRYCFNVYDGMEGNTGWIASSLPRKQG